MAECRRVGSEPRRRGDTVGRSHGDAGQSGGNTETRRVGSGADLELCSVWMPVGWVSAFISHYWVGFGT
jgi:hypothetical protein